MTRARRARGVCKDYRSPPGRTSREGALIDSRPVNITSTFDIRRRGVRPAFLRPRLDRLLAAAALAGSLLVLCATLAAPAQAGVAKGVCSPQLESEPGESTARAGLVREIGRGLGADWVRISVNWAALEPTRGEYSPAELARLDALVRDLRAARVKVILTTCYVPAWATRSYWWTHPPAGLPDGPQPFYPIRDGALRDYTRLGEFLARHFKGRVQALECGNEPNLWTFLYPQRTASDPYFAARVYLRMLKAFHAGVARARTGVRVVAGATAPVGLDDIYRTSPQRFARFLQRARAGRYFDVYSHHPYTPGGSINPAPEPAPQRPFAHGHALQPAHAAAPVPQEAVLPHGVRVQHAAEPHVRALRQRAGPGAVPEERLQVRGTLPAGPPPGLVPGARPQSRGRGRRLGRVLRPAPSGRGAKAGVVRLQKTLSAIEHEHNGLPAASMSHRHRGWSRGKCRSERSQ